MASVYWAHLPEHTDMLTQGYIGFTAISVKARRRTHLQESLTESCGHYPFYRALKKYRRKIIFELILVGDDDYCLLMEQRLRPTRQIGWNISAGGGAPNLGNVHTLETRKKMSIAAKGRPKTDQWKNKMSQINEGRIASPEAKMKMSLAAKARCLRIGPPSRRIV